MSNKNADHYFLRGGGEMGELIRAKDWAKTSLGNPADWPQSLQTMVAVMLDNPFGMYIAWGSEYIQLYNDGYRPILGATKHPQALGISTKETFSEIWDNIIGSMFDDVMKGKAVGFPDLMLPLNRNGFVEECYFDFSYSPIRKDNGEVGGVLVTVIETTNKKKAEEALKESEARFRAIADDAPVFIFLAGENAEVEYLNKTWREYTGISINDSKGRAWAEITHVDDIDPGTKIYMDGFNRRESCSFENRQKGIDGIYRNILWKATPRFALNGQFIGMMGVGLDIHERKKSEEKLWESERQKAFLLKLSDTLRQQINPDDIEEAVTKISLDFLKVDWCHFCIIEGDNLIIHRDAVRGTLPSVVGLYPISSYPLFKAILDDGHPFVVDNVQTTRILDAALKQLCVHLQNIAFINVPVIKNGKPVAMLSLVQSEPRNWTDAELQLTIAIAERTWAAVEKMKAEKALLKSEEKYRTLFNSIDQGFLLGEVIRNNEGKGIDYFVHEVNATYEKQTGINIELVLGKTVLQAFPTIDKWWIETYASVVDNQYPVSFEKFFEFTNRWFEIKASPAGKEMFIILFTDITERILAVEKIKESEEKLNIVIEASELGTWEVDLTTNDFSYSNRYLEIMGYPHNKKITVNDTEELVHQDYREAKEEAIKKSRETGVFYFAGKIIWEDKSIHWIESKAKLFYDEQNHPIKLIGTTADITKEKNHQKTIEANEEKLSIIIEASELGTYELNLKTKEPSYSKRYLEILGGYKEDIKLTHAQLLQHLHPDDLPIREKAFKDAMDSGYLQYEARVIWIDKSIHWMEGKGKVFYDEENKPVKLIGTIRDTTEEKNHEEELKKSEEQFSTLADNMENLAWLSDGDGWIYWYNKRWYDYTGTTLEEMKGWGWGKVHHPDHIERVIDFVKQAWQKNEPWELTFPLRRHDGEYRWFLTRGYPVTNEEGKIIRWIGTNTDINEQKKAEEQFKVLANQAPMWVWLTDKEVNVLYANPEVLKFIGIAHYTEFTGNVWEQKVHPEDIGMVYHSFGEAASLQQSFSFEFRVLNASTRQYEWFYIKAVPRLESGEFTGFIGTGININEQRLILSQLEYRKALLEAHNESSLDGILLVDTKGKILSYNHRFVKIWNMPQPIVGAKDDDAALTFALTQLVHPDQFIEKVKWLYEHPDEISIDELEFKDGKIIERHGYPVAAADGSYYAWSWMFRDITEKRKSERTIKESEEKFRLLADSMPQHIWTSDPEGNLNYYNQSVFDYSGLTLEQINKDGWIQIVHPDDKEENIKQWLNAVTTGKDFLFEHRFRRYDGEYRWQLSRAIPQKDKNGNIQMWVGTSTDIQDQKTREEKKDEFISIASHEMKTPLTTAKAYLQMLELLVDENNGDASLYTKKASQSVNRLNELISELLDVSKIRLGKLNYTVTTFNFNEMIESAVENIQLTSPTHSIIKTGKVNNLLTGDKDRLEQVVINLLTNAIKYSPGAEKVFVTVEQAHNDITVSVKDTGIGIAQQSLDKIFEKYHRVEEHAVHFQGLGIGLFISYEIIQRHHGKLWAESEVGKGSTFYFTIPLNTNLSQ